jgi:lysophospholipase L1-like esterase
LTAVQADPRRVWTYVGPYVQTPLNFLTEFNGGIGGATTATILTDIPLKYGPGKIVPQVVVWQIGVNNCLTDAGRDAFASEYASCINTFQALCPLAVHVFCTNVVSLDAAIQARLVTIQGTYAANWAAFALSGIKFVTVDLFPVLQANLIDFVPDGVHPSRQDGYPKIANAVFSALQAAVALL